MSASPTEHPFRWEVVDLVVTALVAETLGSYRPAQSKRPVLPRMDTMSLAPEDLQARPSETSCIPGEVVDRHPIHTVLVVAVVVARRDQGVLGKMVATQQT